MTLKRTITIEVEMTSGASEADLHDHIDCLLINIKNHAEDLRFASWYKKINTSWDESESENVDITITAMVQ